MLVACARQLIEHIRYAFIWHKLFKQVNYHVITALSLLKKPLNVMCVCDYNISFCIGSKYPVN
jgi:hypothetical protein